MTSKLLTLAAKIPKMELHLHLDGSLSQEFIKRAACVRGRDLATELGPSYPDVRRWLHSMKASERASNPHAAVVTGQNWKYFDWANRFLQTKEELITGTVDVMTQLAYHNVRYAELRFCPSLHCSEGLSEEAALNAVLEGFERGKRVTGVVGGIIICVLRSLPDVHGEQMAQLASKYMKKGVVGLDIAGDEGSYPLSNHEKALKLASDKGVPVTVHAGEWPGSNQNLQYLLERKQRGYSIQRIGHGLRIHEDPEVLARVKESQLTVECCLTANVGSGRVSDFASHPIKQLHTAGVPVTLNADNLLMSGTAELEAVPTQEYARAVSKCGVTVPQIRMMLENSISAAFNPKAMSDEWKKAFFLEVDAVIAAYQSETE